MYRAILDLASKCMVNGKWRGTGGAGAGLGLGGGAIWNATANGSANGNGGMENIRVGMNLGSKTIDGDENSHIPGVVIVHPTR
jgi:hypothetical protein